MGSLFLKDLLFQILPEIMSLAEICCCPFKGVLGDGDRGSFVWFWCCRFVHIYKHYFTQFLNN